MSNPFDQFDGKVPTTAPAPPTPAVVDPANPAAAGFDATEPPSGTVFDSPGQVQEAFNIDEFSGQLYRKLNEGGSVGEIADWAQREHGQTLNEEDMLRAIAMREAATNEGRTPSYPEVKHVEAGEVSPGETLENFGTALRTGANIPLFNFGDDLIAGARAVPEILGGKDPSQAFKDNWLMMDAQSQMDQQYRPTATKVGTALGVLGSMAIPGAVFDRGAALLAPAAAAGTANLALRSGAAVPTVIRAAQAGNLGARAAVGAATGATAGAIAATGEGTPDDRFENTGGGALIGSIIGAGFPLVAAAMGRVARPVMERLFPNSEKALGARANPTKAELQGMEDELARQRELGMEPALIDVLPERLRSMVGGMGRRPEVREILQEEAESRIQALPSRVNARTNEEISDLGNTAPLNDGITSYRDTQMNNAMSDLRDVRVEGNSELIQVMATNQGRRAIQKAIDAEPDANRRTAMMGMMDNLEQLGNLPANISESARGQIMSQILGSEGITVGFLDRIRRQLRLDAKAGDTDYAAVTALAETIENAARREPRYAQALDDYASRSRASEASAVGEGGTYRRNDVGGFLGEDPDAFRGQVRGLREQYPQRADPRAAEEYRQMGEITSQQRVVETQRAENLQEEIQLNSPEQAGVSFDDEAADVYGNVMMALRRSPEELQNSVRRYDEYELLEGIGIARQHGQPEDEGGAIAAMAAELRRRGRTDEDIANAQAVYITNRSLMISDATERSRRLEQRVSDQAQSGEQLSAATRVRARNAGLHEDNIRGYQNNDGVVPTESQVRMQTRRPAPQGTLRRTQYLEEPTSPDGQPRAVEAARRRNVADAEDNQRLQAMSDDELLAAWSASDPMERSGSLALNQIRRRIDANPDGDLAENYRAASRGMQRRLQQASDSREDAANRMRQDSDHPRNRLSQQRGSTGIDAFAYDLPEGGSLTFSVKTKPNSDVGEIVVGGISDWDQFRGQYGARTVTEVMRMLGDEFPNLRFVIGGRVTGARARGDAAYADPYQTVPVSRSTKVTDAPTEPELARAGAARIVKREAGKGPAQAESVSRKLINSPDQRMRTNELIGKDGADRLRSKLQEELDAVYRVKAQATREGPVGEDNLAIVESGVNTMYNPASPIPWLRESLRFLHKVGISEKDASWIVEGAIDPSRTDDLVEVLTKYSMSKEQAYKYLVDIREGLVRYATLEE